ncbi:toprim domain-containing protein [Brevibacillus laterosporus]|uniref:hypothetical protein n=1 Tax=Brevibacillus laterosporus TaxID=1465 RepID=UPI003D1B3427
MDVQELKERIIQDEKIEFVLEELGMHSIRDFNDYFSCGMPDGDNQKSTIVYKDSLYVDAHTRNIKDQYGVSDIISLVTYIKGFYFSQSLHWLCDICGYSYYEGQENESKLAEWVKNLWKTTIEGQDEVEEKLQPIDSSILKYYGRYANPLFLKDGVNFETQWEFELGYDLEFHMITIPIYDELNKLVGIKGRLYKEEVSETESKYFYLFPCAKAKILYGLNKTLPYIKEKKEVIVCESEKGVMQLWNLGIKNAVAISGHKLSKSQVQKLTHLNVPIVLAYDQGAENDGNEGRDKNFYPNEFQKFLPHQELYCIYDKDGLLKEKESPMDNPRNWEILYKKKYRVR